jgi:hypothetical protein
LWWGDHCNHCNHSSEHNSNHLSVHQWVRPTIRESQQPTLPIGFLILKLPPPPCAVLLVYAGIWNHKNQIKSKGTWHWTAAWPRPNSSQPGKLQTKAQSRLFRSTFT